MDSTKSTLTDAEVNQIAQLIETLDRSTLDFLQIDSGGLKVTIGKGNSLPAAFSQAAQAAPAAAPMAPSPAAPTAQAAQAPAGGGSVAAPARPVKEGELVITAPMMGRFYSKPDPASPPFVTVGSEVDTTTSVGLIEVMKLFNTVQSGVEGIVTEICVPDGEFIEYGTPLFRLRPKDKRSGS